MKLTVSLIMDIKMAFRVKIAFRVRVNETYSISHNGHKGTYKEDPELCE